MKRTRIIGIIFVLILAMLIACGCQSSNAVSQAEYDKIVAERDSLKEERDHYKELYENATNGNAATNPTMPENAELIVELTKENFGNYFEFVPVPYEGPSEEMFGDCIKFAVVSKLYDEGWIFIDVSGDFVLEVDTDPNNTNRLNNHNFECETPIKINGALFAADCESVVVSKVEGRIRYRHINFIDRYEWDTYAFRRYVQYGSFHTGESIYLKEQIDYPY